MQEMQERASVSIDGRPVVIRPWKCEVKGVGGSNVPVYSLDTNLPENAEWDRTLTHFLYGGDQHYRLCQEAILGIGGVRILRSLGSDRIKRFHMNEGHAALLSMELLYEEIQQNGRTSVSRSDIEAVRQKCIFTTHTAVPVGHDQCPIDLVRRVFGLREGFGDLQDPFSPVRDAQFSHLGPESGRIHLQQFCRPFFSANTTARRFQYLPDIA